MSWQMTVDGMAEISELLNRIEAEAPAAAAEALYEGAAVMRKGLAEAALAIRTAPFKYARGSEKRLPSPEEKQIVLEAGVGVAKFDRNGYEVSTSVGYNADGYADVNWNHMSSKARTNYKKQSFHGKANMTTSTLKFAGAYRRGVQNTKPIGVIANAINSGTSFMQKQPFFRKGVSKHQQAAMDAMKRRIERRFEKYSKSA